jgi:hypothetical protein
MAPPCETKPITRSGAPRRRLDCGLWIGTADRTSTCSGTPPAAWRPGPAQAGCTNNPIGRSQGCKTNPIPGGRRGTRPPGARDAGQSCKTNPIPPERPGRDAGGPEARPGTNGAKRTQLPGAGHRGGVGESAGGWNTHYSSILSFHHSIPMPIVRNEPNSRRRRVGRGLENEGRTCETKPIQPRLHLPPEWNGAKQTQFGPAGRQAEVSAKGKHAKQSQSDGPHDRKASAAKAACAGAARDKRAKQSQFRRGGRTDKYLMEKELWRI